VTPVHALARVRPSTSDDAQASRELFALSPAGDVASMTTLVVLRALDSARPSPGVHRVEIDERGARVSRVAASHDTFVCARVVREGRDAVKIVDVTTSYGDGADRSQVDARLERSIAEAVAAVAPSLPVGAERTVDVVVEGSARGA